MTPGGGAGGRTAPLASTQDQRQYSVIDTHCHLDAYPDPRIILADARASGVSIVAVTENPGSYRRLKSLLAGTAGVEVALGLHPLTVYAAGPSQSARFLRMLPSATWIGEIGLDLTTTTTRAERHAQIALFDAVLSHAQIRSKILTVHSRGAAAETITRLTDAGVTAILHWFTGGIRAAAAAVTAGLSFSVNPAMTASRRGRALVAALPQDRVLLESDGPYCQVARRSATPADMPSVVRQLSRFWDADIPDTVAQLRANHEKLLARVGCRV
jgi:TatD DNase family protein